MSRRPADQVARSREPEGRQPIWDAIQAFAGAVFTVADLRDATGMPRHTISSYLAALTAGGFAERIEPPAETNGCGREGAIRYRLTCDPAPFHAPRLNRRGEPVTQGAGVENMWRTMRMLPEFSPRDVAAHATVPDLVEVSEGTAKAYIGMLFRSGYLKVVKKAVPKKSQAVYRLIRNSGPLPPQIQRVKQVFDPNTRTVHTLEGRS